MKLPLFKMGTDCLLFKSYSPYLGCASVHYAIGVAFHEFWLVCALATLTVLHIECLPWLQQKEKTMSSKQSFFHKHVGVVYSTFNYFFSFLLFLLLLLLFWVIFLILLYGNNKHQSWYYPWSHAREKPRGASLHGLLGKVDSLEGRTLNHMSLIPQ